jgi:hypothetical protein
MDQDTPSTTGSGPDEVAPAESESGLRELALALLMARYAVTWPESTLRLLIGQLPPGFPVDVPLPEGSRILGSLIGDSPTAVLAITLPVAQTTDYLRQRLGEAGWAPEEPMGQPMSGFISSMLAQRGLPLLVLTQGDHGPSLHVQVLGEPGATHSLAHLTLISEPAGARAMHRRRMAYPDPMGGILPSIYPPEKSLQLPEGGSSGDRSVTSIARVETDLDLATLMGHYNGQLEGSGWQRREGDVAGPVAWSTWGFHTKEGEHWRGLFLILDEPDAPRQFYLTVRAVADPDETGSGGMGSMRISFAPLRPHQP